MSISLNYVRKDFKKLKSLVSQEINAKHYTEALDLISCASELAYSLNFIFSDDELEKDLKDISERLLRKPTFTPMEGRWVFYDCIGFDNKGLTQQYITALESWGVEFLYILETTAGVNQPKNILEQLKNYDKATLYIQEDGLSYLSKLSTLKKVIDNYKPEKAFLHLAPWSSLSVVLWNSYKNKIDRYFINLTDHAFWIGKNSFDYCIEFREYGYQISRDYRNISDKKLLMQEYYPIVKDSKFLGFPNQIENKKIIFSGGTFYKILGFDNIFFKVLKSIVEKNKDAVILFASNGHSTKLEEFIKKNSLEEQIILLGYRSDINEVMKHCDIYLNTFPVGGGLMLQYALLNKKIPISFGSKKLNSVNPETWNSNIKFDITFYDIDNLSNEVYKILNDENYRNKHESMLEDILIQPEEFNQSLNDIILKENTYILKNNMLINDLEMKTNLYLENENKYVKRYDVIKFRWLGMKYFKYNFFAAVKSTSSLIINNHRLLNKKILERLGF